MSTQATNGVQTTPHSAPIQRTTTATTPRLDTDLSRRPSHTDRFPERSCCKSPIPATRCQDFNPIKCNRLGDGGYCGCQHTGMCNVVCTSGGPARFYRGFMGNVLLLMGFGYTRSTGCMQRLRVQLYWDVLLHCPSLYGHCLRADTQRQIIVLELACARHMRRLCRTPMPHAMARLHTCLNSASMCRGDCYWDTVTPNTDFQRVTEHRHVY